MSVGSRRLTPIERCRSCGSRELSIFLSLGDLPLSNGLLSADQLATEEPRYPLDVALCGGCSLVQIMHTVPPEELFGADYPYLSSFTDAVVHNAAQNVDMRLRERQLGRSSLVVEPASNDGYLLQHYAAAGVPVLGIDPTPEAAAAARARGVETIEDFFGRGLADQLVASGRRADVIHANNVLAHVADTNNFVAGIAALLKPEGIAVIEGGWRCHVNCRWSSAGPCLRVCFASRGHVGTRHLQPDPKGSRPVSTNMRPPACDAGVAGRAGGWDRGRQEALGVADPLEALHLASAPSGRLMRILGPVVEVLALAVLDPGHHLELGRAIAGQFVRHDGAGYVPQPFQQLPEEALRRFGIPAALHQDVEHGAVLVDGAPEVMPFAADAEEHLIEMPFVPGSRPPSAQPIREALGELQAPAPDRLVGEDDAALGQEQLDVPEAQRERVVEPDRVGDDRGREAVTMVWIRSAYHPPTMAQFDPDHHAGSLT